MADKSTSMATNISAITIRVGLTGKESIYGKMATHTKANSRRA
jgi:hypothetical protein